MEVMDLENPNHQIYPHIPAVTSDFFKKRAASVLSSGHITSLNVSGFLPKPLGAPQTLGPSSSSEAVEMSASVCRPMQTGSSNDISVLPTPTYQTLQHVGTFPNFQTQQSHSTGRVPPYFASTGPSSSRPPVGYIPPSAVCGHPQTVSEPSGIPMRAVSNVSSGMNKTPFSNSSLSTPKPNLPLSHRTNPDYAGPPLDMATQPQLLGSRPFMYQQEGNSFPRPGILASVHSQQGCIGPPPLGIYSKEEMRLQGDAPPTGGTQGLTEDFSYLCIDSLPGSIQPELESKEFPRPLDGDVELVAGSQMYPMNCSSKYLRFTTLALPISPSLASRWHFPLGAVVCPFAETPDDEVPKISCSATDIIRCRRCRIYLNSFATFTDGGRKWQCNFCSLINDVPGDYFFPLDSTGRRIDLDERPELTKGSVDFIASGQYMLRPPMPPVYFFLIDVSLFAVASGMLEVVAQTIKSCLDRLPGAPRTQIGFITFDSAIHFYNLKCSLREPQMIVASDLDDLFLPLPEDLLVNLSESRTVVDAFLDSLCSTFQDNSNVDSALVPAIKAAVMVMGKLGGKLLIFQNTLPSLGIGNLRSRGDFFHDYGTEKEHLLRIAEDSVYEQMAEACANSQIAVNVYAFSDRFTDVATLGNLAKFTGGQLYYYPSFNSNIHAEKLRHELSRDLTRETAWEAVLRVRCGKGIRHHSFLGNFVSKRGGIFAFPAVDCDKAYAMQFSIDEALLTTQTVYVQVALLYTSSCGERRIRVHTAAVPVARDLGEMYRQADTGAIISLVSRLAIEKSLSCKLEEVRDMVQQMIVKGLREYKNLYVGRQNLVCRLIYPDSLKFLLLYGLALCKSIPLRGGFGGVTLDERCAAAHTMMVLPVERLLKFLYPDLVRLDESIIKESSNVDEFRKSSLPLTVESIDSRGLYLYDDGFQFIVWFGQMLSPDVAMNLLGVDFARDFSMVSLSENDSEISKKTMALFEKFREADPSTYQLCHLVRQGDQPREGFLFLTNLIEDRVDGMNSYEDWIRQIHRQVQQKA